MASIWHKGNGSRVIEFVKEDGTRGRIFLGKAPKRTAETFRSRVEELLAAKIMGEPPDRDALLWVKSLDDTLYAKLAKAGLVTSRESTSTLIAFVDRYISDRSDVKGSTSTVYRRTRKHLLDFFGGDRGLRDITTGDGKDFRRYLLSKRPGKKPLAEDTTRRTCGIAKQVLEDALDRGLIERNPFKHREIPTATGAGDKSREFFISRELAEQVIDALPDAQWKLMFALARYGGLRCPSEVLSLRWGDIDWDRGRIVVTSPKTEHHDGGESRVVPLFPELRPFLDECFELAPEGAEHVITRYRKMDSNYGVLLGKLVRRAGLTMWPKPWQNLRSTRETELAEEFPMHVVCAWIGNSQRVAAKHYLQVTDEHFATAADANGWQNRWQQPPATATQRPATGNPAEGDESDFGHELQGFAGCCDDLHESAESDLMGDTGLEPVTSTL